MIRTYYCGALGLVKRLDNFLGPWVDLTIPGVKTLYDIMTDPSDPDHVVTVGEGGAIYVSTNAGAVWNVPTGNYTTLVPTPNFYEVWVTDSNTIFVVGSGGACVKSTDGGLTFNLTATLPTVTGTYSFAGGNSYCTHFPTPLMGVAAFNDRVFKTIDGGITWTQTNGGLSINNPQAIIAFRGIQLSIDGLTITAWGEGGVYRSTDGGASYMFVLDFLYPGFQARPGEHLTWLNDNRIWGTTRQNEIFLSTNSGASWTSLRTPAIGVVDSDRIRAAHFYTLDEGFYSVNTEIFSTSDAGATGTVSDSPDKEIWAVWTNLDQQCYQLTSCVDGSIIITSTNYSEVLGQYVSIGGNCYLVELSETCVGAIPLGIGPRGFDSCAECVPLSCYVLEPCEGTEGPALNVSGTWNLGTVVTILEFPGCYLVAERITPCQTSISVTLVLEYPDCECCADTPAVTPVLEGYVTYYCGYSNCVRVSEDEGTTWQSRDVPASPAATLLDVKAFPNNGNKAITVGTLGHIYLTQDKGVTWTESSPVATPGSTFAFEEVWHVDAANSFVVGENITGGFPEPKFFRSNDGGLSYVDVPIIDTTGQVPFKIAQVISVHFISPMIGVIGMQGIQEAGLIGYPPTTGVDQVWVLMTVDGGDSWEVTNNKLPIDLALAQGTKPWGIKLSLVPGNYVINLSVDSGSGIYRSIDSGNSYAVTGTVPTVHLTWFGDIDFWVQELKPPITQGGLELSSNLGATWVVQQTYTNPGYAAHFYDNGTVTGFYSVSAQMYKSLDLGATGTISDSNPSKEGIFAVWTEPQINYIPIPDPVATEVFTQSHDPLVKNFSNITDSQCTIDTNIDFANAYYQLYKAEKNGIKVCGVKNIELQWLKKELLDIRGTAIDIDCCITVPDPPPTCP